MERYSHILEKDKREIVLLKSRPCIWGKCSFCDYIEDNDVDQKENQKINDEVLNNITGQYGVLEVINSGSFFELPDETIERIYKIIDEKKIKRLYIEAHYLYKKKIKALREKFKIEIIVKTGIETFNDEMRNNVLNKNVHFDKIEEILEDFDSPCLMVGIQGQTKEMIRKDIEILTKYFNHGTINIYRNNSTPIKRDEKLIKWFDEEYHDLKNNKKYDYLGIPTDFGVGD
ncbi:MAG: radical SAM protein [[Clostridium] spiroforme]|uniref:Radical SAM protein n=1 Tax=Thomasclavelia spiroformis TaxID=29348 RepID=A0A943EK10_9FIRM|nr:radical SAM protein [Thomasclavelia spiroformis]MBS5588117.1 radical SAM protein [Thomasclavelia spiroformis]